MSNPVEVSRLESALERAATRARLATQAGRWSEAEAACREAEGLREQLGAARRPRAATNIVGRPRVRG